MPIALPDRSTPPPADPPAQLNRSWPVRYTVALLFTILAAALRISFEPIWGTSFIPFVFFYPALAAATWFGRLGPGLLALATSGLVASWRFLEPMGRVLPTNMPDWAALISYLLAGGCVIAAVEARHRARGRAEQSRRELGRTEKTLELMRIRAQSLADAMPQLVWTANGEGEVDYYNSRVALYAGFQRRADGHWDWQPVLHPDDVAATTKAWADARARGQTYEIEHRVAMTDGTFRWHLSRAVPMRDDSGQVLRWFGTATEIHSLWQAQRALRDSQQSLELALSGAGMGVWAWDLETDVITWSPEIYRLYGIETFGGTREASLALIEPEDRAGTLARMEAAVRDHTLFINEYRVRRGDGSLCWISDRGRADYDASGRARRVLGVVMDITERKQTDQALEAARDAAVAANRAKDDFLAMLSHELRTPLNPVLLVASEAANDRALPELVRMQFQMIASNVALEARLIDDLLDLNRIVLGKTTLERRPLDLHATIRDAATAVEEDIGARHLRVGYELNAPVASISGDPVRLRQVVWNVLKNAVKFTPAGGSIRILSRNVNHDREIEVRVCDSGIGMTEEELANAFQPFVQGQHAGRSGHAFGGLGVGLAISRTLVERHEGHIHAESRGRGQGTCIVIRLPVAPAASSPTPAPAEAVAPTLPLPHPTQARVLLVDDHAATLLTLRTLLERRGYRVTTAATLTDAEAQAESATFDLLISDLGLPDGDGCALMQRLRARQPTLFGVAISGYGTDADFARSRAAGFRDHLTKPLTIGAIEHVLTRFRSETTPSSASRNN